MDSFYIARQPIVDRWNKVAAYELFFRGKKEQDESDMASVMTATSINNFVNVMGVENVVGQYSGFIKITPLFLKRRLIEALPSERIVFSIFLEDLGDHEAVKAIEHYKAKGYQFALNDLGSDTIGDQPELLTLFSYIKLDYKVLDEGSMQKMIEIAHRHEVRSIASKIETHKAMEACRAMGCDYFQGYFFKEPEVLEEQPIQAEGGAILRLWNLIRNDAPIDELVRAFEQEHAIALQLLRFVNSPFFSLRKTVTSIRHLITLLGRDQLSQWLLVMLFAKDGQKEGGNHPLVLMVINRTELMVGLLELIEPNADRSKKETAYLVGILSLIHLFFHCTPRKTLKHMHVSDEIEDALFEAQGFYGQLLKIVRMIENNEVDKLNQVAKKYHLPDDAINKLVLEAMKKVNAFDEALKMM